jgi:hypothetical protein
MVKARRWLRDELIIAMNIYCKLPFGKLHHRTPLIMQVAEKLGRTPSSLAMKLVNFASLDPDLQARGIKGLQGASQTDREVWKEFHDDWDNYGYESENKFQSLFDASPPEIASLTDKTFRKTKVIQPPSITESEATVKVRIGQIFFRETILANYEGRCCITGNPIPELLVASHILPWSKCQEHRLNPCNGLCLSRTQDTAFDRGLITINENYELVLSGYLNDFLPDPTLEANFANYGGKQIRFPEKFHL